MKLKVDENGNAVLVDGKPVYVHEDGKEVPFDAPAAMEKINTLNTELTDRRHNVTSIQKELDHYVVGQDEAGKKVYLSVDDAKKAMETVKNFDEKSLLDATGVEKLKLSMNTAYLEKEAELKRGFSLKEAAMTGDLQAKEGTIYELMVNTQFANSPTIRDKTVLPSDSASEYFGKYFKVEGEGKEAKVIGYYNNEKILSRERPGEVAEFEEALAVVIDHYPMKEHILKSTGGGSGSQGNRGGGGHQERDRAAWAALPATERLRQIHLKNAAGSSG
jgi:hypothetical protein